MFKGGIVTLIPVGDKLLGLRCRLIRRYLILLVQMTRWNLNFLLALPPRTLAPAVVVIATMLEVSL